MRYSENTRRHAAEVGAPNSAPASGQPEVLNPRSGWDEPVLDAEDDWEEDDLETVVAPVMSISPMPYPRVEYQGMERHIQPQPQEAEPASSHVGIALVVGGVGAMAAAALFVGVGSVVLATTDVGEQAAASLSAAFADGSASMMAPVESED